MQHKSILIIIISLFSFAFTATGQKLINSPYSRFNIGTMEPAGSFRSLGMGGVGVSFRDNSSLYYNNPASYSSLDTNSFVFDFGLDYGKNFLSDGVSEYSSDDMNFHHLLIGFPLSKGWGFAAGVIPFSNGYYQMSGSVLEGDPEYDPVTGEYSVQHTGEGGFTNFFLGSGINITRSLSVGVNMTILMGKVDRTNRFDFVDYYNVFSNISTEKLQLSGINLDYGIQHRAYLNNDYFFNSGISVSSGKSYKTKHDLTAYKYVFNTRDTLSYIANDSTRTFIPGTLRLGISFGKKDKFITGLDFIYSKWSNSKIPGTDSNTADTKSIHFGAEYIPDKFSNYSFVRRLEYRIGAHIGDSYLFINGEQIKEYGASIGLGIPMGRSYSKINMFFDFTKKTGSLTNGLHNENYYSMGISLNLYDYWFLKRKYD